MNVERLIKALSGPQDHSYVEDILDALWLATRGRTLSLFGAAVAEVAPAVAPPPTLPEPAASSQPEAPLDTPLPEVPVEAHEALKDARAPVYGVGNPGADGASIKASPVALPAGRAIHDRLQLSRALRPLRQRWPSHHQRELDEERTAEMTAELGGQLHPVFHPLRERWFDVDVILEDDTAICVWADTLRDFSQILRDTGAFREVRTSRLQLEEWPNAVPMLKITRQNRVTATSLAGRGVRRLVMFATHGFSKHWLDGRYAQLLESWARSSSVVLLQLMDRRSWKRGVLGEPDGTCSAPEAGAVASTLRFNQQWWSLRSLEGAVRVPVVALTPASLDEWSHMQMARGRRSAMILLESAKEIDEVSKEPQDYERAVGLLHEASPEAFQLAVYLCAGAFTIPVARLVQEVQFGTAARQQDLSEVLLSGLLFTRTPAGGSDDLNELYYEFRPEARAILLRSLREADANRIAQTLERRVSQYIEAVTGRVITFRALIPDAQGQYDLPRWAQPFARLGLSLLGRSDIDQSSDPKSEYFDHPAVRELTVEGAKTLLDALRGQFVSEAQKGRLAKGPVPQSAAQIVRWLLSQVGEDAEDALHLIRRALQRLEPSERKIPSQGLWDAACALYCLAASHVLRLGMQLDGANGTGCRILEVPESIDLTVAGIIAVAMQGCRAVLRVQLHTQSPIGVHIVNLPTNGDRNTGAAKRAIFNKFFYNNLRMSPSGDLKFNDLSAAEYARLRIAVLDARRQRRVLAVVLRNARKDADLEEFAMELGLPILLLGPGEDSARKLVGSLKQHMHSFWELLGVVSASAEPILVYVSYAWDDPTAAWVDELERKLPASMRLLRDKNEVRPGGWISRFMQDIGRAQHVVVVLSAKYLQSQYCMRELLYLHDRSLGDRAELMGRIVPVVMEDLKISAGVDRLAHVIHWQERHNKQNAMIDQVGIAAARGAARDELLAMKNFVHRTDELLSWLNDVLMPRVRKGNTQPTTQAVIDVLLRRTALRDRYGAPLRPGLFIYFYCKTTMPQKYKYGLVVLAEQWGTGVFLVNRGISEFVRTHPDLLGQQIELHHMDLEFLTDTGWLDCSFAHSLDSIDSQDVRIVGHATEALRLKILEIAKQSKTMNRKTKTMIERGLARDGGREREVEWERNPADAVLSDVAPMDQDSRISPLEESPSENQPLASGEPVPVYVSYAWDDPTAAWVDGLERSLPPSLRLLREKNEVRPGGWISKFMQDIGRAHYVVVVLSTKYLQSQYCMRELLYLHDRSLGDRAELMGRIVPVVMEDLRIAAGTERLKQVKYWKDRHGELAKMMDDLGVAATGGATRDELLAMKDFVHRTDELLSWLNDVLMPRVRKGDGQSSTIQAMIALLLERINR